MMSQQRRQQMKDPGNISFLPKEANWLNHKQSISPNKQLGKIRVLLHLHPCMELGVKVFHLKLQGQV